MISTMSVGSRTVVYEAPEAGRYRAPLLLAPGLFQSFECWRPLTSMLAHRGWEVFALTRSERDEDERWTVEDAGWAECVDRFATVAADLDDTPIFLGADVGAAIALAASERTAPLAHVLFAPCRPAEIAENLAHPGIAATGRPAGIGARLATRIGRAFGRRGDAGRDEASAHESAAVHAAAALAASAAWPECLAPEPRRLLDDLAAVPFTLAEHGPPTLSFAPDGDPIVSRRAALEFAQANRTTEARTSIDGRFWAARAPQSLADELHRFLILELGDRVVDFPDEILKD